MLQHVQRTAHEWGVGDSKDVVEIRHPDEEVKGMSPAGDKVFLH